jgi:hypothetical protein
MRGGVRDHFDTARWRWYTRASDGGLPAPDEALGGMAEWLIAAVLKTADRKIRGFESLSLRLDNAIADGEVPEWTIGAAC